MYLSYNEATAYYCVLITKLSFQKCEGVLQPEYRKFSVDPQITSFEVLQSILAKAFDIRGFVPYVIFI
jgi:hypothetical protein